MDLPRALNHRLRQSCCHCPVAHHISHSQTSLAGERNEDTARVKVSAMSWCVHAGESAIAGAQCILLPLQRHCVHQYGDTLCKVDHPNHSYPHSPGMTFGWARLYITVASIQAVTLACVPAPLLHAAVTGTPERVLFCSDTIFRVNPPCKHLKGLNYVYYTSTPLRQ